MRISDYRCFYCFASAFQKLLETENVSTEAGDLFTRDMARLYYERYDRLSAPEFSRKLHLLFRKYTKNHDPYKRIKEDSNRLVMSLYHDLKNRVLSSSDPFDTALRLSIAGNIMDYALNDSFDLLATIEKVERTDFALNHSPKLKERIRSSGTILYLGDNAGEIVFDRLFIETIDHPGIIYAVRSGPVINDVTIKDAEYTGMTSLVKVISTGYDAPSVIPERSGDEFRKYFDNADIIISKGQGNLEGLYTRGDDRIFFLLMAKCSVIADLLKVNTGSFVVYNNSF